MADLCILSTAVAVLFFQSENYKDLRSFEALERKINPQKHLEQQRATGKRVK